MNKGKIVTPAQCRAARAILFWTQATLAGRAGVARKTIADFERDSRVLHIRTRRAITAALEEAGVGFIAGDESREALLARSGAGSGVVIGCIPTATDGRCIGQAREEPPVSPQAAAR